MKIAFAIYSEKGTPGGHFFSLEHITHALARYIDITIIFVGFKTPKVIENLPYPLYKVNPQNTKGKEIRKILIDVKPDVIHCFDARSYLLLTYHTLFKGYKFLLTKAGGASPKNGYPFCKDYVLFSLENLYAFQSNSRYSHSNHYLISNRVDKNLLISCQNCNHLEFTFLQIIRFAEVKLPQILKSFNLISLLKAKGVNVKFVLAGTVNHDEVLRKIKAYIQENNLTENVELITDNRVNRGSDLLSLGDCIIGTGRSVMEATCLDKTIVVPSANSDFPILMDKDSFEELYKFNFSGRTEKLINSELELEKIQRVISDAEYRRLLLLETKEFCKKYFELSDDSIKMYLNIYRGLKPTSGLKMLLWNFPLYFGLIKRQIQ